MGRNKALLEMHGRPLALRAGDLLRPWVAAVTLVGSPDQRVSLGIPILTDLFPDRGPLGGIYTGLEQSSCDWNVFLACDMPFVECSFVRLLRERALVSEADAVLPKTAQSFEPLCPAYHRRCLPVMRRVLEASQAGVVDALKDFRVEVIPTGHLAAHSFSEEMFADVDTAEDWSEIEARLKASRPES